MDFVGHRGIAVILIGRSAIQSFLRIRRLSGCTLSFDYLNSSLLKKCISGANNAVDLCYKIKIKVLAEVANS